MYAVLLIVLLPLSPLSLLLCPLCLSSSDSLQVKKCLGCGETHAGRPSPEALNTGGVSGTSENLRFFPSALIQVAGRNYYCPLCDTGPWQQQELVGHLESGQCEGGWRACACLQLVRKEARVGGTIEVSGEIHTPAATRCPHFWPHPSGKRLQCDYWDVEAGHTTHSLACPFRVVPVRPRFAARRALKSSDCTHILGIFGGVLRAWGLGGGELLDGVAGTLELRAGGRVAALAAMAIDALKLRCPHQSSSTHLCLLGRVRLNICRGSRATTSRLSAVRERLGKVAAFCV